MQRSHRRSMLIGLAGGAGAACCAAFLMGQAGSQPPGAGAGPKGSEYFVTGDMSRACLWQRDGTTLRFVSQAESVRMPPPREPTTKPMDPPTKPTDPPK